MKRILATTVGLALLLAATLGMPAVAAADSTHQQAINTVIARALSQRGVPFAYGGGTVSGPSLGTATIDTPATTATPTAGVDPLSAAVPATGATGLSLTPLSAPVVAPRVTRVGFDASGLMVYAFAGAGIKMPRTSGDQYKVGQKVLPSQALPGDLLFYGPDGTESVAMYLGNGQMVEATDPAVTVSPVRTAGMAPYLVRIIS
jgi:cell wall-associated NlpC family hydrolase